MMIYGYDMVWSHDYHWFSPSKSRSSTSASASHWPPVKGSPVIHTGSTRSTRRTMEKQKRANISKCTWWKTEKQIEPGNGWKWANRGLRNCSKPFLSRGSFDICRHPFTARYKQRKRLGFMGFHITHSRNQRKQTETEATRSHYVLSWLSLHDCTIPTR